MNKRYQSDGKSGQSYLSVGSLIGMLLTGLFVFFFGMGLFLFTRIQTMDHVLGDISNQDIPAVIDASQTYSKANLLLSSVQKLTVASTPAAQRIAISEINNRLSDTIAEKDTTEQSLLNNKILLLRREITGLNDLIANRILLQKKINNQKAELLNLFEQLKAFNDASIANNQTTEQWHSWALSFATVVALTNEALTETRLNLLRDIRARLETDISGLVAKHATLKGNVHARSLTMLQQLHSLVLAEDGLISNKAAQLRLNGRAIGRGHMVNNLVQEFSRISEAQASNAYQATVEEIARLSDSIKNQTKIYFVLAVLTLFALLFALFVIRQRIIIRLHRLNKAIQRNAINDYADYIDPIHDEIGELAKSFNTFVQTIDAQQEKLEVLSLTDELTGIANRRHFEQRLAHELGMVHRHQWSLSVMLVDVDYFKAYNDTYGHSAGDDCLRAIASILQRVLKRDLDLAARYGGEEFVCVMQNTDANGALKMATELHSALKQLAIKHEASQVSNRVTYSIGIATIGSENLISRDELLKHADMALYHSKKSGRNTTTHYQSISGM